MKGRNTRPLKYLFKRQKVLGAGDELLLSIYRDYGVVAKESRDDNFNKSSDDLSKYQVVHSGDLVVNKMKAWQGSVAVSELDGIMSPAYFVYKPSGEIYQKYAHYLLRSGLYFQYYASISTGVRPNQWDLDPMQFDRMPVPTPPPIEQRQIADYLDHETAEIDAFITDQKLFLDMTGERLVSIRSHLFTSPDGKDLTTMRRLAKHVSGGGFPVNLQGDPTQEIPFFKVGSLKTANAGELRANGDTISRDTARALGAFIFPRDTVVLAKIGAALYLNRNARLIQPSCIDIKPLGNPGAVPSLNMSWYRGVKVWLPALATQQRIVEKYEHHESLTNVLMTDAHRSIDLARERRAALITAAVTGQIDVTAKNKPAAEQLEDDIAQGLHKES